MAKTAKKKPEKKQKKAKPALKVVYVIPSVEKDEQIEFEVKTSDLSVIKSLHGPAAMAEEIIANMSAFAAELRKKLQNM